MSKTDDTQILTGELARTASSVEQVAELARRALEPSALTDGVVEQRLIPKGFTLQTVTFPERELAWPRRKTGIVQLADAESLSRYIDRHHRSDATTVWIDDQLGKVTAVLNDHSNNDDLDNGGAEWGDHRAILKLRHTPEWEHWTRLDGQLVDQQRFAEHIDQGLLEVVEPDGATLLEIAQTFHATTEAKFRSAIRLSDGNVQFQYDEEAEAKAGRAGELQIPSTFTLASAPYIGEDVEPIEADLRYRVRAGALTIGYRLRRPHDVLRMSLDGLEDRLSGQYAVLRGTPRS